MMPLADYRRARHDARVRWAVALRAMVAKGTSQREIGVTRVDWALSSGVGSSRIPRLKAF